MHICHAFALLLLCWLTLVSAGRSPLWPQPSNLKLGEELLWVDRAMSATLYCGGDDTKSVFFVPSPGTIPHYYGLLRQTVIDSSTKVRRILQAHSEESVDISAAAQIPEQDILRQAVRQTLTEVHGSSFVPWKFHKRHSNFEPSGNNSGLERLTSLTIKQWYCPTRLVDPKTFHGRHEAYGLTVQNGSALIESTSSVGTLRALGESTTTTFRRGMNWCISASSLLQLESFKQLFYTHSSGSGAYTPYAPVSIQDSPRFSHRGISLDIARNPFTPDDVMRTIDAMATAKMNRLHLHATDSQSWPLDIPSLPELAPKGAYQPHLVWSTEDLDSVQSYGDNRGVMVYLELDMPGHTASVARAYPDLIAAYNQLDWSKFAAEPQSGQFKLNSLEVKVFLDTLFADLLPRLTTHSAIYHLGGDEVNRKVHLLDETVNSSDFHALKPMIQQIFDQILRNVKAHGLRPVVWEEMVIDWDLTLPPETLVQVWRNSEHIEAVIKKGFSVIFGDYLHWYVDCGLGGFLDPYPNNKSPPGVPFNTSGGRPSKLSAPYLDYCAPYHNWRDVWSFVSLLILQTPIDLPGVFRDTCHS